MEIELYNKRMIKVMLHFKQGGITQKEFLRSLDFEYKNLYHVKNGSLSFTLKQVARCIRQYRVNPAYFFKMKAQMFENTLT